MQVWVTRTQPQAENTAERLRAMGHEPVVQPVLEIQPLDGPGPDLFGAAALAFTSQAGVDAFAALSAERTLPVFTTGDATAKAARQAGFAEVLTAGGNVQDLAAIIARSPPPGAIVWPCAAQPAGDLASMLRERGVQARSAVVYRSIILDGPPPGGIESILIHSGMAARAVAGMLTPEGAEGLSLFAISAAAAAPLMHFRFTRVALAPRPNETALLSLLNA